MGTMYNMMTQNYGLGFAEGLMPLFVLALVWNIFWKGLALWHSGRRGEEWWFIALLFLNTLGILEIIYLFTVAKRNTSNLFSKN